MVQPNSNGSPHYSHQIAIPTFGLGPCPLDVSVLATDNAANNNNNNNNCRIEANLQYLETRLCHDNDLDTARQLLLGLSNQPPFLLMIHRGGCPLADKVQRAKILQADADIVGLVIATTNDDDCRCESLVCETTSAATTDNNDDEPCDVEIVATEDEENDMMTNTHMPAIVLLKKDDTDRIREELPAIGATTNANTAASSPVRMAWSWNVPVVLQTTDSVMALEFWHLPSPYHRRTTTTVLDGDDNIVAMMNQRGDIPHLLGRVLDKFSDHRVQFVPKFHVVAGSELLGCRLDESSSNDDNVDTNLCLLDRCTNNGRYCAEDPHGNSLEEGETTARTTGANLVEETLRRMCIWDQFGSTDTDPIGLIWWKYLEAFHEMCTVEDYRSTGDEPSNHVYNNLLVDTACSRDAMTIAGIDFVLVSRCVLSSGGTTDDKKNVMLEASLRERQSNAASGSLLSPPTVTVNGISFRGNTLSESFGAICASFASDTMPDVCELCANCAEEYECLVNEKMCSIDNGQTATPTIAPTRQPEQDSAVVPPLPISSSSSTDPQDEDGSDGGDNRSGNESKGGLNDTTKMVIVVAVVGCAILAIFAVVLVLVWKLLKRIQYLEGKGKQTPTTSSPAGSGIWKLPSYVTTKEDPYNSDCEPLPEAGIEQLSDPMSNEFPQREEKQVLPPAISVATATEISPGEELKEKTAAKKPWWIESYPNNQVVKSVKTQTSEQTASTTSGSISDDQSSSASKPRDKGKGPRSTAASGTTKPNSRRPKQQHGTTSLLDIMGKAAPEAKIPRSFSYEDEEKEEIEEIIVGGGV